MRWFDLFLIFFAKLVDFVFGLFGSSA